MSEFSCPVVKIEFLKPVPNSDALEMTTVFETNVIVRKGQLKVGDLAVYIPLDALVPMSKPQFQGLGIKSEKELYRVKAVRLRGTYSEGLLVPYQGPLRATNNIGDIALTVGQDMAEAWGIAKYEEAERPASIFGTTKSEAAKDITWAPKYNVESILRNREAIPENTQVVVTEKIHGCNARYAYGPDVDGTVRLHVGSHNTWRRPIHSESKFVLKLKNLVNRVFGPVWKTSEPANDDVWWTIAKRLDLAAKLAKFPKFVVYGEVYGKVQDLQYGVDGVEFRVFDVYDAGRKEWLSWVQVQSFALAAGLQVVPPLYTGPYIRETVDQLRFGKSALDGKTLREGFVIRPLVLLDPKDKSAYKYVSEDYKLRKGNTTEFH